MKKNFGRISFLFICLAINIKTMAHVDHNDPSKPVKTETKKEELSSDKIYAESYLNNAFSAALYFQRGTYRFEMKQYEAAVSDFNKAIDLDPFNADAYLQRAKTKDFMGQKEEAIEDYQLAAYLNPMYKKVQF